MRSVCWEALEPVRCALSRRLLFTSQSTQEVCHVNAFLHHAGHDVLSKTWLYHFLMLGASAYILYRQGH